jgi:ATP-dependent helicase HrpA
MNSALQILKKQLSHCRTTDHFQLSNRLKRLDKKFTEESYKKLTADIQRSCAIREQRTLNCPTPEYPPELPVSLRHDEIIQTIKNHQVVILCGETGSGKTTQIPKMCLDAGRGINGFIGLTQPRRLAARSVTSRLAEELKSSRYTAYKIRFQDQTDKNTYIKVMTDGILLAEIQHDRFLNQYDTLIIDEAHERSLNIDFLLGYLKWLLPRRRDLKLIITSATIDPERFSQHFNKAPIIEVSGRTYPVDIRYSPLVSDDEESHDRDRLQGIIDAINELKYEAAGDILIFLSGEREIRETAEALRKQQYRDTEVLPLYARLSAGEQNRIFRSHRGQRIILSTNVAETSLTVPGIKYVIDPGEVRISRYSWRSRIQRLPIEKISQASANQRSGRCGRTSDGIAIRLYSEEDYLSRPEFTDPEIVRTNLASVILQMAAIRLGDIENFPFVEAPDSRLIKDGFKLLFELHAVDDKHQLTTIGKQLSRLPVDPRLGRMLIAAERLGAVKEVLIIISALSIQDPRERPMDKQQAADEKHSRFKDKKSDFLGYLKLWNYYHEQKATLSQNKLRKLCRKEYLSFMRLREWNEIHHQIRRSLPMKENSQDANEDSIHQSLLTGLLSHIGNKDEEHSYLGSYNRKFMIFPGSGIFKKSPKWVMAAEMVETSRLYARTAAKIQPQWLEACASHLIKHHYSEPHWQKRNAQVGGYERLSLYGLTINPRRTINFGAIDPILSRQIFIRHALVYGEYQTNAPYFRHNQALIEELKALEAKSRRRDILVDEEMLYDYYDKIVPASIYSGRAFEKWRKKNEQKNKQALFLTKD